MWTISEVFTEIRYTIASVLFWYFWQQGLLNGISALNQGLDLCPLHHQEVPSAYHLDVSHGPTEL